MGLVLRHNKCSQKSVSMSEMLEGMMPPKELMGPIASLIPKMIKGVRGSQSSILTPELIPQNSSLRHFIDDPK